jgi:hypothetical protein
LLGDKCRADAALRRDFLRDLANMAGMQEILPYCVREFSFYEDTKQNENHA